MPKTRISLDRLLETSCKRDASDILVAPDAQVLIRLQESWRALQAVAVEPADVERMCQELFKGDDVKHEPGYATIDFNYGDVARFRAIAFGFPSTRFLLIAKFPDSCGDETQPQHAAV